MIISRTPYRVSLFGGGSDYPAWYKEHGGTVLSVTINKYCYISVRYLPPFFEHKYRIVYSKVETVNNPDDIEHRAVWACIRYLYEHGKPGLEIHHDGDLPARSGMGSSSAFTVGLLHALHELKNKPVSKLQLAKEAIHIEREVLGETVGSQDQVTVTYGGMNKITFDKSGSFSIQPVEPHPDLEKHLLLLYTGISRIASLVASTYNTNLLELETLSLMAEEAVRVSNIDDFGGLLDEAWRIKKSLSGYVTTPEIDSIYSRAKQLGALGGKLLGAGGGGFMLLFAQPELHKLIADILGLLVVPLAFEGKGTQIIFKEG